MTAVFDREAYATTVMRHLTGQIKRQVVQKEDESVAAPVDCAVCLGTGEGLYDGSSCGACRGRGYLAGVRS